MAYTVKIVSAEGTIDFLSGTSYVLLDQGLKFSPLSKKQVWVGGSSYLHGSNLISSSFENRTIEISFKVRGTSMDNLINNITLIERTLERARRNAIYRINSRVELQFKIDGATNASYFEIIDGDLKWPEDLLSVENILQQEGSYYVIYDFVLTLVCYPLAFSASPYSGSMTALPLTNGNGTNVTSGLVVQNHDDSGTGHDNWVSISGSSILGGYPSLLRLELQTRAEIDYATNKVHIGVEQNPTANLKTMFDNSDATYVKDSPTPVSDGSCSGGTYTRVVYSPTSTGTLLFSFSTTAVQSAAMKGAYRVFGRTLPSSGGGWDAASNYKIAFWLTDDGLSTFDTGWIRPQPNDSPSGIEVLDFGVVFINQDSYITNQDGFEFKLYANSDVNSKYLNLDYIYFLPVNGGYRVLEARSTGAKSVTFIDDGWIDVVYAKIGSYNLPYAYGLMPRLTLLPGKDQKLFFLMQSANYGSADIDRYVTAKVYYVPQFNVLV
jgi:hypothetical protein